jgi:hypothetical protein
MTDFLLLIKTTGMKKLLFMFLTAGIFAACNDVANGVKEKKDDRSTTNKFDTDDADDRDDRKGRDEAGEDRGGGDSWSKKERSKFIDQCEEGLTGQGYGNAQARQLCDCVAGKLEKKYSSLSDANEKGGEAAGARAIQECAAGGGYGSDDDNEDGGADN